MTQAAPLPAAPAERLLCGPGPANIDERVLAAMDKPLLGYLDPDFIAILDDLVSMLRLAFRRDHGLTIPLSSTGTAAMEAGIGALIEPGETVVVGVAGYFGRRIAEIATRHGARVIEVEAAFGEPIHVDQLLGAVDRHPEAALFALVHAETSTGVHQPVAELGTALASSNTLLMVDCVTSFAGNELQPEPWSIDYAYSCTQKCLGGPPGMAPVSLSERALERVRTRPGRSSFTFDLELLSRYWIERPPVYHHTPPALQIYALHEALRLLLEEGLERRWQRHLSAGQKLQAGLRELGLELLADESARLPQLTAVQVPDGIDGKAVQRQLLHEHALEVGGGLGPSAPPIWRIGLMGVNATSETADRVVEAFSSVLAKQPAFVASNSRQ
jgi:alanine-glyoxylate transaminase/serine-glyoxylate transaminase/serine-pyruvate transaminase